MLDKTNATLLIDIARNEDTPAATRVQACALLHRTNELCANDIVKLLQEVVDEPRTKKGIQVKALDLLDKISQETTREPELSGEDEALVRTSLLERFVKCPTHSN